MAPIPGPLGSDETETIDEGTMCRTRSPLPVSQGLGMGSEYQFALLKSTDTQQESIDNYNFPLAQRPEPDWTEGSRRFGAPRGTTRLHGGCDLLASLETPIYAIADGVLVHGPYQFTGPKNILPLTGAVEIRHGNLLVRYGEIKSESYVGGKTLKN